MSAPRLGLARTAIALALAAGAAPGCAVLTVAGSIVGTAVSVTGAVVTTAVKATGAVVEGAIDLVTPDEKPEKPTDK